MFQRRKIPWKKYENITTPPHSHTDFIADALHLPADRTPYTYSFQQATHILLTRRSCSK